VRDIFILNEIWAKEKEFGRHFAWMKYFACHLVPTLAANYKQLTLSPAKFEKHVIL
jgi:hypothetical protein